MDEAQVLKSQQRFFGLIYDPKLFKENLSTSMNPKSREGLVFRNREKKEWFYINFNVA